MGGPAISNTDDGAPTTNTPLENGSSQNGDASKKQGSDSTNSLLLATYTYDAQAKSNIPPSRQTEQTWLQTWQITATPGATEKNITVMITSDRAQDSPFSMRYMVKPDGSIIGTSMGAQAPGGAIECTGQLPIYLPPGQDSATVDMACQFNGRDIFGFKGTAQSGLESDFNWKNQKSYKIRTITLEVNSISPGVSLPAAIKITSAPGLGPVTFEGSISDLIFGQLGTAISSDNEAQLASFDNDQIWLP